MSDIPEKLPVKDAHDLFIPTPETKPEIHKVDVPPEPDWQKEANLTIGESLGRIFRGLGSAVDKTIQVISDIRAIESGAKWVAIAIGLFLVAYIVIHFL